MPLTALILNQTYPKQFRPENTPTHNANSKNRLNIDMICITLKKKFSGIIHKSKQVYLKKYQVSHPYTIPNYNYVLKQHLSLFTNTAAGDKT